MPRNATVRRSGQHGYLFAFVLVWLPVGEWQQMLLQWQRRDRFPDGVMPVREMKHLA
jgi:hypothetical protein